MELNDNLKWNIKKFDGKDFSLYKDKIINAVKTAKCYDAIEGAFNLNDGDDNQKKAKSEADEKAKFILMSTLQDGILRKIPRTTSKEIWTALKGKFEEKSVQNVIYARKRFLNAKQQTNETCEDFIERIRVIRSSITYIYKTFLINPPGGGTNLIM